MSNSPQAHAADLLKRGYVEIQEFRNLTVGSRVRHCGEQYADAYIHGTGNIERIFQRHNSGFEAKYGPDVELIVKRDKPRFGPDDTHAFVADYHVAIVALADHDAEEHEIERKES